MKTLQDWLQFIESQHSQAIALGLERVAQVFGNLGISLGCPVITVGGTNGKGSTCAMLEAILGAAGYRTGLYTSPHLLRYNERVRIAGREADDALLCEAVFAARVRPEARVRLSHEHDGARWLPAEEAKPLVTWPAYERAIDTVEWLLANPTKAVAFRLPDPR